MDFSNHTIKLWNMQPKPDGSLDSTEPFNTTSTPVAGNVPTLPERIVSDVSGDVGLYWQDGIEPTSSTIYPLTSGRRIWYVDMDASTNGDGSENSPLNNFTDLLGYMNGASYVQGSLGFQGGDQIWVTGTATAAKNTLGSHDLLMDIRRENQCGTEAEPTVIRSWKGRSRAVFDGNYTDQLGLYAQPLTGTDNGLVVLNIEGTRCTLPPVYCSSNLHFLRVESCYTHYNYGASGSADTYGGIKVRCSNHYTDTIVRNCRTERNNTSDGVDRNTTNNIGGINLLCQASADPSSVVSFINNEVSGEAYGLRHKHSGNCTFNSYGNVVSDCDAAHYIRNAGTNNIHDNDVSDCPADVYLVHENQSSDRDTNYYANTLTDVDEIIVISDSSAGFANNIDWYDNVYVNADYSAPVLVLGRYGSNNAVFTITGSNNSVDKDGGDFMLTNQVSRDLSYYATLANDSTTVVI